MARRPSDNQQPHPWPPPAAGGPGPLTGWDPDLEPTRRGSTPSRSPQREGKEGVCLLRARDPVWPARPLSLPEQPRQGWPLSPTRKTAGREKGNWSTRAMFRNERVWLEGVAQPNGLWF